MERTAEVRWFFQGPAPEPLSRWFERSGAGPEERSDRYLRLPETDALGVKLRGGGGNFELKLRARDHGATDVAPGIVGNLEEWQKWSFPVRRDEPLGLPTDALIEVRKVRRMVTCTPPDWAPVPAERRGGDGCNVELADLLVGGQRGSTLGFEAFGSTTLESLRRAASGFFGEVPLTGLLPPDSSFGYPGWLQRAGGSKSP